MKVEKSNLYWAAQHSAVWGFYWSLESRRLLLDRKHDFLKTYIKVCVKYGICVPVDYLSGKTVDQIMASCLERIDDERDWYILNNLYLKPGYKTPLFPCMMYKKDDDAIHGDFYVNVSPLSNFDNEEEQKLNPYINDFCKVWSFRKTDNSEQSILFYLETDAFFNELSNHSLVDDIDNSDLAYYNTPRLNSFIRDVSILFFEYGAQSMAIDNLCEFVENGRKSRYLLNNFLLVGGELIFYEDIYSLLPDVFRYKEFEKTQVVLVDSNYRKYLENEKSQRK